ncbi:MAG: hypothetical protein A3K90_02045 [Pelodictyon luteolum]|uniref:TPR repeat n=2 Tax=Pelodictyon luteolum TaxID=1100 RepID=A0A165L3L2_PELLU|nr:MAG: hypothetical protein A3K90_02045 [Pelodictyon luteolum]
MIERAEQNIIKADELIESRREAERKALRAAEVRKACDRAGILAESGDLAGAKAEWKRALTIVRDPEAKSRIIEQVRQAEVKTAAQRAERKLRIESLNAEGTALFERRLLDESQARFRESLILEASNPEARRYIESVIPAMRNELRLQAAREEDAKAAMEKGRSLFADGDLKGSVAKWREALRMTSDTERSAVISSEIGRAEERGGRASSCAAEGVSLFQSGDIQAAEAMFREALALDPMQLVAMDYLEVKVPARKVELHRLAVAEAEARAAFEKGNRFFAEGDAEGAGTAWREADAATRDPELKAAVAAQFRKAEERAAAERAAAEARLAALVRDGESLFQSDRLDEADAKFRNALALDPSNWSSHQHVDVNIPKRRQELERLALVEKNVAEVALRGEGFLKSGDLEGAKAAFLEAVVIAEKPESKGAMMEKVAQVTAAQQHRATELQTRIVALASEGEALYRTDSLQASEAKFKELVALDASNLMATGYLNDTIPARKAELERRAVVAKQARAAYENGSRIAATGDLKGALDAWNEALDIVEEAGLAAAINAGIAEAKDKIAIAQGLCDEGAVLFKLGSLDRSASKYQEALAIDPMNLAAMDYLEVRLPAHRAELMRQRKNAEREARIAILVSEGESLFKADSLDVSAAKFKELLVLDASNSMATPMC